MKLLKVFWNYGKYFLIFWRYIEISDEVYWNFRVFVFWRNFGGRYIENQSDVLIRWSNMVKIRDFLRYIEKNLSGGTDLRSESHRKWLSIYHALSTTKHQNGLLIINWIWSEVRWKLILFVSKIIKIDAHGDNSTFLSPSAQFVHQSACHAILIVIFQN